MYWFSKIVFEGSDLKPEGYSSGCMICMYYNGNMIIFTTAKSHLHEDFKTLLSELHLYMPLVNFKHFQQQELHYQLWPNATSHLHSARK
jgi:hypothetical protein